MEEQATPDPLTEATLTAHAKTHEVYRLQAALDQVEEIVRELLLAAPKTPNDAEQQIPQWPCSDGSPAMQLQAQQRYNRALSRMVDWLITHSDRQKTPPLRVQATIRAAIQGAIHEHSGGFTPFGSEYDAGWKAAIDVWDTWYTLSPLQMSQRLGHPGEEV